jgi:ribulose-5-phosphate 4-epimerase/fuculose-1-phosphate aldolase
MILRTLLLLVSWTLLAQPPAPVIEELVTANRILANEGVLDAYGHVSIRDPAHPNHYFLARSMPPSLVTSADIVEYDLDSKPVGANPPAGYQERFIHGEIYRKRPDVMAIVHCHAPEVIPFSASSVPLRPISHMAAFLGEGVPVFEIRKTGGMTDMLIKTPELGKALAETLGQKPAALMRGHGAVVVAETLHAVVGRAYYMNMDAKLQEQAILLGGKVTYLEGEEARKTAPQDGFERAWAFWKQKVGR